MFASWSVLGGYRTVEVSAAKLRADERKLRLDSTFEISTFEIFDDGPSAFGVPFAVVATPFPGLSPVDPINLDKPDTEGPVVAPRKLSLA